MPIRSLISDGELRTRRYEKNERLNMTEVLASSLESRGLMSRRRFSDLILMKRRTKNETKTRWA